MVYAIIHFIGGAAALAALIHVLTRQQPRDASRQPLLVVASLLALIAAGHILRGLEFLHFDGLGPMIDYCRVLSPLLWIFLIYAWVRGQDAMKLEASQRKVQAMIDRMPVMVDAFDDKGLIALWNHECERVTGYSAAEMVGNPQAMELLYPDAAYRERMLAEWRARPGAYRDWRWEITCKDGTKRTIAWSNVSNEVHIEPWIWWGVGVDLTEQERTQARLIESEARFRMFMDQSPAESFIKDEDGRYLFGNRAWAAQFGKPPEEILGKTDRDLWPPDLAKVFMESDEMIRRTGRPIHVEEPGPTENGRQTWFDVYKFPVLVESGRTLVGGIVMDITDRKNAAAAIEEWRNRFEAAINSSEQVLYDWNAVTNDVIVAGAIERVLGCGTADVTTLHAWESRIHPDDLPAFRAEIERVIATRQPFSLEYRMRHGDGHYIHAQDLGYFFNDAQGNLSRMVGFMTDITERKKAQQQRQHLESQLIQTQRLESVGNLAAGIAHDFSNLLTAISGHLALAYRGLREDHPARKSLDMIERAAQQGVEMTRSLLTFANKTPSAKRPCDLRALLRDSIQIFRHMLAKNIEVKLDDGEDPAPWAMASPSQMQQVLMNLIVNARDAMPDGGTLRLAARLAAEAGPGESPPAVITVEDTGTGMDEQTLAQIFEPFFTTKERHKGTGLGLSMVHGIVTDHGGKVVVDSQPGRGTRFDVVLPSCPPQPTPTAAPQTVPPASRRRGVLLVHQQDFVSEIMVTALESAGFTVIPARSPAAASAVCREHGSELGVVVYNVDLLPESEEASLSTLQESLLSFPLIAITASAARFLDEPAAENRFILPKPFQMSQLVELVNRALGIWKPSDK